MSRLMLMVACALQLTCLLGCHGSGDEPGYVVTPGMVTSVPFDPYEPNDVTASGQTLQHPPAGTLPYGTSSHRYGVTAAETKRAGRELHSLSPATPAALARGKWVYGTYCGVCHGDGGHGDGSVIGPGRFPNPASLVAQHAKDLPDGAIYHIITVGQGLMPSHAVQVSPADRWHAVRYVRKLQAASTGGGQP